MMLPIMAIKSTDHSGSPKSIPMAIGIAPLSSISGTIDTRNTKRIFQIIFLIIHYLDGIVEKSWVFGHFVSPFYIFIIISITEIKVKDRGVYFGISL